MPDIFCSKILEVFAGSIGTHTKAVNRSLLKEHELIELANAKMHYGKYAGRYLIHLPEPYLVWYKQKGFPKGKLGRQLALVLEIKINGLEHLIYPLIKKK